MKREAGSGILLAAALCPIDIGSKSTKAQLSLDYTIYFLSSGCLVK